MKKNSITFDKKVIVFEDIDCMGDIVLARDYQKPPAPPTAQASNTDKIDTTVLLTKDDEPPVSLDDLLNLWDGIRETPGRIMVMSSNHYDKLDPAIRRPGRVDITLELSYSSREIISEMYTHLFGETLDTDILSKIADKFYSPAEIINIYMSEEMSSVKFLSRLMKNEHVV
jgi:chaperone BCS1